MNFDKELTLLSEQEVWGVNGGRQLDVLEKYGTRSAITDLVILTGGYCEDSCSYMALDDNSLKGRTGWVYTRSSDGDGDVRGVILLVLGITSIAINAMAPSAQLCYHLSFSLKSPRTE